MNRHKASRAAVGLLLFCSASLAQQDFLGTYAGTFISEGSRNNVTNGVVVQIVSIERGNVTGTFKMVGGSCVGDYPIDGKLSGDRLRLRMGPGTKLGCGNALLILNAKSGKLVGTFRRYDIELTKE